MSMRICPTCQEPACPCMTEEFKQLQAELSEAITNHHDSHCNCDRQKYHRYEEGSGCSCSYPRQQEQIKQLQAENKKLKERKSIVKHPIGCDCRFNRKRNYCVSCGTTVKNQRYCHNCGKELIWSKS